MKNLFITGSIGIGKSSVIRNVILPYINDIGGYYVQRLFVEDKCKGFCLCFISDNQEYVLKKDIKSIDDEQMAFLINKGKRWIFNNGVFERYAVNSLENDLCKKNRLLLLDEVGGMELLCPRFKEKLYEILDSDLPCLGVIKSDVNSKKLIKHVEPEDSYMSIKKDFIDYLNNKWETKIIEMDNENYVKVEGIIRTFVEVIMKNES